MRSKLIQCDKCSTFYDPAQHSRCPYCPTPGLAVEPTVGVTVGAAKPPPRPAPAAEPPTKGTSAPAASNPEGVTIGVIPKKMNIDPVVGWLVCIAGKERGRDYRIYSDRNFVGRGETMKICIKGDPTISREKHMEINFDTRHAEFYIAPGEGRGNTYLNDRPVLEAKRLEAMDIIEVGETKLVFVPFCNDRISWSHPSVIAEQSVAVSSEG
ncbi:MAG: FHA domain-containing protein [Candidatus Thiosymbion ectosymbiont of Robbea hypermnestra]|nr:FHA domain-containing protein [Candidatus Thiosymbion ectosymbiont of Robbea hypermnestra]